MLPISNLLRQNIIEVLKEITGVTPVIKAVPLGDIEKLRVAGDYDILAASIPVNDLNVDGAMAFFFGLTPPLFPGAGDGSKNFRLRIENTKKLNNQSERNAEYRKIMTEATQDGCLLPLFHFSTVVIAKKDISLSPIQTTDEAVAFSKVRFK